MSALLKCLVVLVSGFGVYSQDVTIDLSTSTMVHHLGQKFVGMTLDSSVIEGNWRTLNLTSPKAIMLAKALTPSYFRVGGTAADFMIFKRNGGRKKRFIIGKEKKPSSNYTMTGTDWDKLNYFVENAGLDLIFDLNVFLRKDDQWDPSNTINLLKYTVERGYKLAGVELGNELNSFHQINVSAQQDGANFLKLKHVLSEIPGLAKPLILGPDVASVRKHARAYVEKFLKAGGKDVVDVVTFHHYYMSNVGATLDMFHSPKILDSLLPDLVEAVNLCRQIVPGKPVWLGETSAAYHYSKDSFSRLYVGSFMWLDKLGLATRHGIRGLMRQSFYGSSSGFTDKNMNPTNDFWITYMYKRLVGRVVLNVTKTTNENIRYYAHCTNVGSPGYEKGSITVYLMNLGGNKVNVNITGINKATQQLYIFSPGDQKGLQSEGIKLNGKVLQLTSNNALPSLSYQPHEGIIPLNGYNMGFIVLPGADLAACH